MGQAEQEAGGQDGEPARLVGSTLAIADCTTPRNKASSGSAVSTNMLHVHIGHHDGSFGSHRT